jgi:hypothetical protein
VMRAVISYNFAYLRTNSADGRLCARKSGMNCLESVPFQLLFSLAADEEANPT